ncbi:hypothetical protein GIB67_010432 [Kingdonia uniflora]|uniref:Alpha/beta hydrolase fold-3 domain-containing protein n=1 Tax=Kingdonia uniflora TaxID=39325 RepID=A0A7J7MAT2_9MAGN|nr:hypothetical protein GIB67_010432 [Kingdonia uniflora]
MVGERTLVDEVSGWLRIYDDGWVDRTWTGPPEAEFMSKPVPAHEDFIDGVATRDVTIDPSLGLTVRIYVPKLKPGEDHKLPVLLHFHGGGFCISEANSYMYYHVYTQLVRTARVVCVSVNMRLAPEHRLPAACDDCYMALLWLRAIARGESFEPWLETHGDFTRVFLIGDSSGGNLVHEVAARAGSCKLSPLKIAGSIPIHPGFVRTERSKSEQELQNESPFLTLKMVDKFLALALPIGTNKGHPITCPMGSNAPPLATLNLPPMMVCIAEKDLIRDTGIEYCNALKKSGKDLEVFTSHGVGHSFYLNKIAIDMDPQTADQTKQLLTAITDFIQRH